MFNISSSHTLFLSMPIKFSKLDCQAPGLFITLLIQESFSALFKLTIFVSLSPPSGISFSRSLSDTQGLPVPQINLLNIAFNCSTLSDLGFGRTAIVYTNFGIAIDLMTVILPIKDNFRFSYDLNSFSILFIISAYFFSP